MSDGMEFRFERTFRDYIQCGNNTTNALLDDMPPLVEAIEKYHDFFRDDMWVGDINMSPNQAFLSMNAFMIYMSAIRMALTGHVAATYPLFRTALESACYAFLISQDKALGDVWANRHKSDKTQKKCRSVFTSAVSDAADQIAQIPGHGGHGKWIKEGYQMAIDFGAHPNPKSIYHHIQEPEDIGSHYLFNLAGLYPVGSTEINRSLMACLDYGLLILVILAHGLDSPTAELSKKLTHLNDLKETLFKELNVGEDQS